jgi:hypothetical protein
MPRRWVTVDADLLAVDGANATSSSNIMLGPGGCLLPPAGSMVDSMLVRMPGHANCCQTGSWLQFKRTPPAAKGQHGVLYGGVHGMTCHPQ